MTSKYHIEYEVLLIVIFYFYALIINYYSTILIIIIIIGLLNEYFELNILHIISYNLQ